MRCPINLHPSALIQVTCLSREWIHPASPFNSWSFQCQTPIKTYGPRLQGAGAYRRLHAAWCCIIRSDCSPVTSTDQSAPPGAAFIHGQSGCSFTLSPCAKVGMLLPSSPSPTLHTWMHFDNDPSSLCSASYSKVRTVSHGNAAAVTLMYSRRVSYWC